MVDLAAQPPRALPRSLTLNPVDYGRDDNLVSGFTQRLLERDRFVAKAFEVYTVHETVALADRHTTTARKGA